MYKIEEKRSDIIIMNSIQIQIYAITESNDKRQNVFVTTATRTLFFLHMILAA